MKFEPERSRLNLEMLELAHMLHAGNDVWRGGVCILPRAL